MQNGQDQTGEHSRVQVSFDQEPPPDESRLADLERLNALGLALATKRTEAIKGRLESGVEDEWTEDQEHYEGIDDANRDERSAWSTKPPGMTDPVQSQPGDTRSTVFVNITRPYVDAASARVSDMLLPSDDRNFGIEPTPIPDDLQALANGEVTPAQHQQLSAGLSTRNWLGVVKAPPEDILARAVQTVVDEAKAVIEKARKAAEKAEDRIDDWFVECQMHGEYRKVIEDAAKIGVGILKGPVPVRKRASAFVNGALVVQQKIQPASVRIDAWNFYPDPACGEKIHRGAYTWERDFLTPKALRDLKGLPGYLDDQIEECLREGPQKASEKVQQQPDGKPVNVDNKFEIWYYHGQLTAEEMRIAGCECDDSRTVDAVVTMVNNRVVRAALNPLDTGEFPYDALVWQRRPGTWTGIGVARQIRVPQRMANAATRNMMDNAGLSAGGIIVMAAGMIEPADGVMTLTPRKLFYLNPGATEADVGKLFKVFEFPNRQRELMEIVNFALQRAEDVTGLPMLLQGQQGKAPDTLGGMQMLNNNAAAVLRRLARQSDAQITEPHVRRYYAWLLQYGEHDDEKGDFLIFARGSSALVERDLEHQTIAQMASIVLNPAFGLNPKLWIAEYLKSKRLNPSSFQYTDDEMKRIEEAQKNQPGDPRIAVEQMRQQLRQVEMQWESREKERDRQIDVFLGQLDAEVESARLSGQNSINTDRLKGMLASTAMKLKTQRELSAVKVGGQVIAPPTEPAGRAPNGQSFQR